MTGPIKDLTSAVVGDEAKHAPTIAAGYVRGLLDFATQAGAHRQRMIERVGLSASNIERQDDRVPLIGYLQLLDTAAELTGEPGFALRFGAEVSMTDISIVGLICQAADTVGEARLQMNRYAKLLVDEDSGEAWDLLELVRDRRGVWLELNGTWIRYSHRAAEAAFARCVQGARALLSRTLADRANPFPRAVHFTHNDPGYADLYEQTFQAPVVFGSDRNALLVDESFLNIRLPPSNRYVFGVLAERAEALLQELASSKSIVGRVKAAILPLLHTGRASLDGVSAKLGMSSQTLYRRLKAEGTSFEKLLDELRWSLAAYFLESKRTSVAETAYLLGFSDPSSFSRAFKRWTGVSPTASKEAKHASRAR